MQPPEAVTLGILPFGLQHDAVERVPAQAPAQLMIHFLNENGWLRGWLFIFPTDMANSDVQHELVWRSWPTRGAT